MDLIITLFLIALALLVVTGPFLLVFFNVRKAKNKWKKEDELYEQLSPEGKIQRDESDRQKVKRGLALLSAVTGATLAKSGMGWSTALIITVIMYMVLFLLSKILNKTNRQEQKGKGPGAEAYIVDQDGKVMTKDQYDGHTRKTS